MNNESTFLDKEVDNMFKGIWTPFWKRVCIVLITAIVIASSIHIDRYIQKRYDPFYECRLLENECDQYFCFAEKVTENRSIPSIIQKLQWGRTQHLYTSDVYLEQAYMCRAMNNEDWRL